MPTPVDRSQTESSDATQYTELAELAFGTREARTTRHLAWAPSSSLEFDLTDPEQRIFGDFELLEKIGEGGMGVVYRARQRSLDREVALKLLAAGVWAHPDFVARFRIEAQSAARMQHPDIVTIHEIGVHEEIAYYSMELVNGPSLAQRLTTSDTLPMADVAALLRTVADAVHYAHQLGVLHLDLKPDNILLDDLGSPKIADFGLARRLDQSVAENADEVRGTPSYMAPEQTQGEQQGLGVATDIYALGAVLYECLTGQPPFVGCDAFDTLRKVRAESPVPPRSLHADVPRDLEAICLKCLAKQPTDRYASARDLADDLGRFREHRPVRARPLPALARWWRLARRELPLALAIAIAVLILLAGLFVSALEWRRAEHNASVARSNLWHERIEGVWRHYESGDSFEALPLLLANLEEQEASGAKVQAGVTRQRLGALFASSPRLIDAILLGAPVESVALSRDGSRVAAGTGDGHVVLFDTRTGSQLWSVDTISLHHWLNTPGHVLRMVFHLQFSADGRYLIGMPPWPGWADPVGHPAGMNSFLIDAEHGRAVTPPAAFADFRDATFSPDGAYAVLRDTSFHAQAWRVSDWTPLGPLVPFAHVNPVWLAAVGGTRLATSGDMKLVELRDPATLAVLHTYRLPEDRGFLAWHFSADGRLLALGDTQGDVYLIDAISGVLLHTLKPNSEGSIGWLAFSDDDRWLVAGSTKGDARLWQVDDLEEQGSGLHETEGVLRLAVDPQSRVLLTSVGSDWGHRERLWQVPADAQLPPVALSPWITLHGGGGPYDAQVAVAARLMAAGGEDGRLMLWRLPAGTMRATRGPPNRVDSLRFDGRHLMSIDGATARLVDADTEQPTSPPLVHPGPVTFATLTNDARTLVTVSGHRLYVWDLAAGRQRYRSVELTATPLRVAISDDDGRVAVSYLEAGADGPREVVRLWNLHSGMPIAPARALPNVSFGWHLSQDGSKLMAWQRAGVLTLDAVSWRALGTTIKSPCREQRVGDGDIERLFPSVDGRFLHLVCFDHPGNGGDGARTVFTWDLAAGGFVRRQSASGRNVPVALAPDGTVAVVGDAPELILPDGSRRTLPGLSGLPSMNAVFDARGMRLAIAMRDGVIVVDGRTGQAITPPMRVPLVTNDGIGDIAFSADGSRVLAATRYGRWLVFDIPSDVRPLPDIRRETAFILGNAQTGAADVASIRAVLRQNDKPVSAAIAAPLPLMAKDYEQIAGVPRDPTLAQELLDLSAVYNTNFINLFGMGRRYESVDFTNMPLGAQRYLGVDYDVRGIIAPNRPCSHGVFAANATACAVDIPLSGHVTTFHLLMTMLTRASTRKPEPLARLRLHFKDNSSIALDILEFRDVKNVLSFHLFPDAPWKSPLLAWFPPAFPGEYLLEDAHPVDEVRLVNPQPDKDLASISVESTEVAWSVPLFYAITIERPAAHQATQR